MAYIDACKISHCIFFFLCCLSCIGCGYHIGDILHEQTIAVPIFHNETLYRGYEFLLTKAVISEILTTTPLQVVEQEESDTVLYGKILKVEQQTIAKDEERRATALDLTIYAQIHWQDIRQKKDILAPRTVAESIEVRFQRGQSLDSAMTEALRKLGRKIVANLEHPYWKK